MQNAKFRIQYLAFHMAEIIIIHALAFSYRSAEIIVQIPEFTII